MKRSRSRSREREDRTRRGRSGDRNRDRSRSKSRSRERERSIERKRRDWDQGERDKFTRYNRSRSRSREREYKPSNFGSYQKDRLSFFIERERKREQSRLVNIWEKSPSPPRKKRKEERKEKFSSNTQTMEDRGSHSPQDERELNRSEKKKKKDKSKKNKKESESESEDGGEEEEEYVWAEKYIEPTKNIQVEVEDAGPVPLPQVEVSSYGGQLLPGEGQAMAKYVQENKRIPRRGEVGLTAEQIETYEDLGYVMSGSRHLRMNAVRIRKESQIYSAEEKRALALFNYEEKAKKENRILAEFRDMIASKDIVN